MLEGLIAELVLLRDVAERLGAKCDYWMAHAQEMELATEYWHGVAASAGEVRR